jgi:hypothetical protein
VHIECCEGGRFGNNYVTAAAYYSAGPNLKPPVATLAEVTEPDTCKYRAVVCTPLLCANPFIKAPSTSYVRGAGGGSSTSSRSDPTASLVSLMSSIKTKCLNKQEDWWTYELCFSTGLRQARYDLEQIHSADGKLVHKQSLVNQYNLGTAPLSLYDNETFLNESIA